jgi:predicted NBD/HSP70 family sugar kinase
MVREGRHTLRELAGFLSTLPWLSEIMCMDGGSEAQLVIKSENYNFAWHGLPQSLPDLPWPAARLPAALAERFSVPCLLDQDARVLAWAERGFGNGGERLDFAAIQVDAGIGGALFEGGHLHRGATGPTAQLGHICVDLHGEKCRCGLRGCYETIASARWLRAEAARRGIAGARKTSVRRLSARARAGDVAAGELLRDFADNLAVGLATIVHMSSVPLFIVHGTAVTGDPTFLAQVEERLRARTLPLLSTPPAVVPSTLDQHAAVLGAAAAVISDRFGLEL